MKKTTPCLITIQFRFDKLRMVSAVADYIRSKDKIPNKREAKEWLRHLYRSYGDNFIGLFDYSLEMDAAIAHVRVLFPDLE